MMKRSAIALLCLLMTACTTTPTPVPTASTTQMDGEEQVVYAAVLTKLYGASNYVIMSTTTTGLGTQDMGTTLLHVQQNMHGVGTDTLDSFQSRNSASQALMPDMAIGADYSLLTQAQKDQLFNQNQDGWQMFYEQYPQAPGITELSKVGFNQALDQALVYVGTQSHWLAGAGYYLLMVKVNGVWTIDQQVMTWIS